ncbi:hypothetical protein AKJ62_03880 [candidate division MSBL1 archaeon SCGC-AAA259D14]|uniref:Uncharacterized protein n=1 Tax=candidate division MSBL1 archaeon SCGC-AAA259D14 TaxID=1698261 RepID=A0A133U4E5_9EURY|nr:hypothetical protein AKJ62_03880 [candidate division MSBL1 archaeon SCGC-AAA259D14]
MSKEDTRSLRMGIKSIKVLRNIKARLTLEFDEDVTYRDALNFSIARSVLDDETISTFVRGVGMIRDAEDLNSEPGSVRSALSELIGLLLAPENERRNRVKDLRSGFRENSTLSGGEEAAFSAALAKITEVPEGALTHPRFKKESGELD